MQYLFINNYKGYKMTCTQTTLLPDDMSGKLDEIIDCITDALPAELWDEAIAYVAEKLKTKQINDKGNPIFGAMFICDLTTLINQINSESYYKVVRN